MNPGFRPADGPAPRRAAAALRLVRIAHTIVWAVLASCVVAIPVLALRGRLGLATALSLVVLVEVGILAANRWRCPLTPIAARYTDDRRPNFDIYLPAWLARYNKEIFGSLYVAGLLTLAASWAVGRDQANPTAAAGVRAARLAQNAALAARSLDSAAAFWTNDVVAVTSRGGVLRGKEAYREAFAGDSVMVYVRTPERIELSTGWPLAWEDGSWTGRRGAEGPVLLSGRYAAQWHRVRGRWLIRSEVFVGLGCSGDPCAWPVQTP